MKKIFAIMFFTCLIIALYQREHHQDHDISLLPNHQDNDWKTFEKKGDQIKTQKTTAHDIKQAKLPITPRKSSRSPASLADSRQVINAYDNQDYDIVNKVTSDWQEKMAPQLMRFLPEETKLFVKKEKSLTVVERGVGRYAEQVYIKFLTSKGRHYSYHALVDSETGTVLKTWNRTQHEGIGHKRLKFRVPSSKP